MKKSIIFGILLFSLFIFGQNSLNLLSAKPTLHTTNALNSTPFQIKGQKFLVSPLKFIPEAEFTIYNKTSQLNDIYYIKKDTFYYQKSVFIHENQLFQPKVDSFSPSGATDFGSALILGVIHTIFSKF